jgi:carbon monoxide dehydrogenase subunit G
VDLSPYHHAGSITIDRPPAEVYGVVSDVTRVGELSPVCASASWDDAAQAGSEGAWFTGHNVIGDVSWDTHCRVLRADPGREFTFVNYGREGDAELVRWGYTFEPEGRGTKVTETWDVLPAYPDMVRSGNADMTDADVTARIDGMAEMARTGIQETLASLKRVVES